MHDGAATSKLGGADKTCLKLYNPDSTETKEFEVYSASEQLILQKSHRMSDGSFDFLTNL